MASKHILTIDDNIVLSVGFWVNEHKVEMEQLQLQTKKGRRFILKGSRTPNKGAVKNLIGKIYEKGIADLSNFIEVKPEKDSEAYKIMQEKDTLKLFV